MNQAVIRAISLKDDLATPRRFAHYRPTRRSLPLLRAILEGGATMAIAPYGSGKSLCAGVGATIVANSHQRRRAIKPVLDRIKAIDPRLRESMQRRSSGHEARVIVLYGHIPDVVAEIAAEAGAGSEGDDRNLRSVLKGISRGGGRVVIVWDEFGRHLEGLVAEGRARDLHVVQQLAEWVERTRSARASLVLLMHQSLLAYASRLNQTARSEWKKIEGRFRSIRFVEDSRDAYELAADLILSRRSVERSPARSEDLARIATEAVAAQWFDGLDDPAAVQGLLSASHPITAAALQALPRVVARLGQNERSLFTFIKDADLRSVIGTLEVYQAFSESMRLDVGIGGTHRRWIETENALNHAEGDLQREAITATCLLQLGVGGERCRVGRKALELAIASRAGTFDAAVKAVDALLARKLLLHRELSGDVSIWHGADIDLASRIRNECNRIEGGFDLVKFLEVNHPPPVVRPTRHNARCGISRYISGRFITSRSLVDTNEINDVIPSSEWGRIYFVIPENANEIGEAVRHIRCTWREVSPLVVFVVPKIPIPIKAAALEVAAIASLRDNDDILNEDPLIARELDELLSIARSHLYVNVYRLVTERPKQDDITWIHAGTPLLVTPDLPVGMAISTLMDKSFHLTPRIINEQVMRNSLSRQIQTAQVRLLFRIMEHSNRPHLGYRSNDTSAEASLFRTVLERPGLHYSEKPERGSFCRSPKTLSDPGLRRIWEQIESYFSIPGKKPLSELLDILTASPFGVPIGVLPILVMAGYRAFARTASIHVDGIYMSNMLGYESRNLFIAPHHNTVTVYADNGALRKYLRQIAFIFAQVRPSQDDELIRFACDALTHWKEHLPPTAWRSNRLSVDAKKLLRHVDQNPDLPQLVLDIIPQALGGASKQHRLKHAAVELSKLNHEINSLTTISERTAVATIGDVLAIDSDGDVIERVQEWAKCLDIERILRRADLQLLERSMLNVTADTLNGKHTDITLARVLSSILLQKSIEQWDDETATHFARRLKEFKRRIEDTALETKVPSKAIVPLLQARITLLEDILEQIEKLDPSIQSSTSGEVYQ